MQRRLAELRKKFDNLRDKSCKNESDVKKLQVSNWLQSLVNLRVHVSKRTEC